MSLSQIPLSRNNYDCLDQTCPRKKPTVKNRTIEYHHLIPHIQISLLVPDFCFNWQFWFFWPDLSKKGFSGLKQKKWTPHIFYIILDIEINLVQIFLSNWQFWLFGPNLPKKVFPVENRKVNITLEFSMFELVLSAKFQFKLIILNSWTKFTPRKKFSSWKQNKQSKDYKPLLFV